LKRIYHRWEHWECVRAGMYVSCAESGVSKDEGLEMYRAFLSDIPRFVLSMKRVMREWPVSCEQFLTNDSINRVAWLGQSSACIEIGLPRSFRGGFMLLKDEERRAANTVAKKALDAWLKEHSYSEPLFSREPISRSNGCLTAIEKIEAYCHSWELRGYHAGITDEAPSQLESEGLAPSYRKIAQAILSNDMNLYSLGFSRKISLWYGAIKKNEIQDRVESGHCK